MGRRKEVPIFRTNQKIALLVTGAMLLVSSVSIPVHASGPFGEIYSLSQSAPRMQESNSQGITFILNVTHAFSGINYQFTWVVRDPSGTTRTQNTQVNSVPSTFTTSGIYHTDFAVTTPDVEHYTITDTLSNRPSSTQHPT